MDATIGLAVTIQETTSVHLRLTVALEGSATSLHFTYEDIKGRSHLEGVSTVSELTSTLVCTYLAQRPIAGLTPQALADTGAWCCGQSSPQDNSKAKARRRDRHKEGEGGSNIRWAEVDGGLVQEKPCS